MTNTEVPGLVYTIDFISRDEEAELLKQIDASPWRTDMKRRVQHYGWRYNYKERKVSESDYIGPLPKWMSVITDRLGGETMFDQVIVNEYLPGQGIAPHIDQPAMFGKEVVTISMGGATTMDFSRSTKAKHIRLEPRSIARLTGDARYKWKHGIAARRVDVVHGTKVSRERRVSITLRTMRK